jgi:hypothetical protein
MAEEPGSKRVELSQNDETFGARALASREKARASNRYHAVSEVIAALDEQLKAFLSEKR